MYKIRILFFLFCFNLVSAQKDETKNQENVPLLKLDEVPVFPGCEYVLSEERRDCFQIKIQEHIKKNFRYPREAFKKKITGKVFVSFAIEKDGNITIVKIKGPHPILEKEAERIITLLPKMKPGYLEKDPVRVPMSIPISFYLD
jgi:protein TonB